LRLALIRLLFEQRFIGRAAVAQLAQFAIETLALIANLGGLLAIRKLIEIARHDINGLLVGDAGGAVAPIQCPRFPHGRFDFLK